MQTIPLLFSKSQLKLLLPALLIISAIYSAMLCHGFDNSYAYSLYALLLLIIVVFIKSHRLSFILPHSLSILCLLVFTLWIALSTVWTGALGDTMLGLLRFSSLLLALWSVFLLNSAHFNYLRNLLLLFLLGLSVFTIYQGFYLAIDRPGGLFLNSNPHSELIGCLLIYMIGDYVEHQRLRYGYLPVFSLAIFAMSVQQGRGPLLVLFILLLSFLWIAHRQFKLSNKRLIELLASLALGLVVAELTVGGVFFRITPLLDTGLLLNQETGSSRFSLYLGGVQMWLEKPILGWGYAAYHFLYYRFANPELVNHSAGQYVHNDYLQVLIELGVVGFVFIVAWLLAMLFSWLKIYRHPKYSFEILVLILPVLSILIHAVIDFNLNQAVMLIVLGVFLGRIEYLQWVISDHERYDLTVASKLKAVALGVLVLYTGVCAWLSYGYKLIDSLENPANSTTDIFQKYNDVKEVLPFLDKYNTAHAVYVLNLLKSEPNTGTPQSRKQLLDFALQQLNIAIAKNPLSWENYRCKANVLVQLNPNDQSANEAYLKSLSINPYQLDARVDYARYLLQQKRVADAKRIMQDSLGKMFLTETSWLVEYWQLFLQLTEQQSDLPAYQAAAQLQLKHLKQAINQKPINKLGYIKLQLHSVVSQN